MREQHLKLDSELVTDRLGDAHITPTSRIRGSNRLILCKPLAEAHRTGWLHRDIKPSNILLLDGHWRLADWGIVRRPRCHTTELITKERIGTEEFAAPELSVTPPRGNIRQ
ncbi:hypothetical protein ACFXKG_40955 [Streptomyces sp. NPDC059255]|uniref:protein kinase domain-containing protein n=1 Tax=Streptomyces sp. NPDC059255 TaxID=3346793 RepID=UPI00369C3B00